MADAWDFSPGFYSISIKNMQAAEAEAPEHQTRCSLTRTSGKLWWYGVISFFLKHSFFQESSKNWDRININIFQTPGLKIFQSISKFWKYF